jgi:tartrate-resistant acid phosphatase type 5
VHPPRRDTIGARSAPYGPARVEVRDAQGAAVAAAETETTNHCWVTGLQPDTEYTYRVFVKNEEWAQGVRWDWSPAAKALVPGGRYDNRFRTNPAPEAAAESLTFAVIGDFGVGMKTASRDRRQQQVANALRVACDEHGVRFILTTGDNIYAGSRFLGLPIGQTGEEDDDWFFTYFQPYRYVLNRVCVYPSIGNHDTGESEDHDDRAQVEDNLYIRERIAGEEAAGRASFEPGLFYRVRYGPAIEFVCIDTSKESFFAQRLFEHPKHRDFMTHAFPPAASPPTWRIPFCHHPPYSAGPMHRNTRSMQKLIPLFQRAGVRAMFSGHEHNFQHSIADGIDYFVSGAAGKLRTAVPDDFAAAHTQSWSSSCHFLLASIAGETMTVRAIGELGDALTLHDIQRFDPTGNTLTGPITVSLR